MVMFPCNERQDCEQEGLRRLDYSEIGSEERISIWSGRRCKEYGRSNLSLMAGSVASVDFS